MKGEAATLSVRAQRCQSHYFSTTPRIIRAIKSRRMGDTCNTYVRDKKCIKLLAGNPEWKVPVGSQRHEWKYNIKVGIKESGVV